MSSKYMFTNYDLLDYVTASTKAITYLSNMLNMYCRDKDFGIILADRIKSLKSINDKIAKKIDEKGKNFDYRVDLLDIAGLRVIFYDKNTVFPISDDLMDDYSYDSNMGDRDVIDKLDESIHRWTPEQFKTEFEKSKLFANNYNVSNLYDFVEYLMRECKSIAIVKDYIMYQKASGYQSIHVTIMIRVVSFTGEIRKVPVEIQFRNYTQHLYNECEHARYKEEYKDMTTYDDVFNQAKRFLLSVANDAYIEIINECKVKKKEYFLIREN